MIITWKDCVLFTKNNNFSHFLLIIWLIFRRLKIKLGLKLSQRAHSTTHLGMFFYTTYQRSPLSSKVCTYVYVCKRQIENPIVKASTCHCKIGLTTLPIFLYQNQDLSLKVENIYANSFSCDFWSDTPYHKENLPFFT